MTESQGSQERPPAPGSQNELPKGAEKGLFNVCSLPAPWLLPPFLLARAVLWACSPATRLASLTC